MKRESRRKKAMVGSQINFLNQNIFHNHSLLKNVVALMYLTWILNLKVKVNCVEGKPRGTFQALLFGTAPDSWTESWLAHPSK